MTKVCQKKKKDKLNKDPKKENNPKDDKNNSRSDSKNQNQDLTPSKRRDDSNDGQTLNAVQYLLTEECPSSDSESDTSLEISNSDDEIFMTPPESPELRIIYPANYNRPPSDIPSDESEWLDGDEIEDSDDIYYYTSSDSGVNSLDTSIANNTTNNLSSGWRIVELPARRSRSTTPPVNRRKSSTPGTGRSHDEGETNSSWYWPVS